MEEIDGKIVVKERRWVVFTRVTIPGLMEDEEKKWKDGSTGKVAATGKVGVPDLKGFIRQFPDSSEGEKGRDTSDTPENLREPKEQKPDSSAPGEYSEPSGSGAAFKPGTWKPPV